MQSVAGLKCKWTQMVYGACETQSLPLNIFCEKSSSFCYSSLPVLPPASVPHSYHTRTVFQSLPYLLGAHQQTHQLSYDPATARSLLLYPVSSLPDLYRIPTVSPSLPYLLGGLEQTHQLSAALLRQSDHRLGRRLRTRLTFIVKKQLKFRREYLCFMQNISAEIPLNADQRFKK